MLRTHKIRLDPTAAQAQHLARACGVARFAWNWALAQWQQQYSAHKADPTQPKPCEMALRRQLNAIKREQFPWMLEVSKCAPESALINLGQAYQNWFASLGGKRKGAKVQAPTFKKKGKSRDSFKLSVGNFDIRSSDTPNTTEHSRLRIPNLGWVRMRESLRFSGQLVCCTVSKTAHAWYATITVETPDIPAKSESQAAVGIDLGVSTLATLSTGGKFDGPKALGCLLQRLRRLSRAHSRKAKGSANRRKSAQQLARLHWRIANVRNDAIHKMTHALTKQHAWIAIEDLNVKGMLANGRLSRHIADASFGEIRRQLTYKAQQRGVELAVVDRFYPSSKTCSACGWVKTDLGLGERGWTCEQCAADHDRDVNAARNILAQSLRDAQAREQKETTAAGQAVAACGEDGSGRRRKPPVKPASVKQEWKHKLSDAEGLCLQ